MLNSNILLEYFDERHLSAVVNTLKSPNVSMSHFIAWNNQVFFFQREWRTKAQSPTEKVLMKNYI